MSGNSFWAYLESLLISSLIAFLRTLSEEVVTPADPTALLVGRLGNQRAVAVDEKLRRPIHGRLRAGISGH